LNFTVTLIQSVYIGYEEHNGVSSGTWRLVADSEECIASIFRVEE
jgi:hypothetical protein